MTNEEAIEILEERWRYSRTYKYTDAEIREAFDMAIEALEQQPCEDCISRQAAINSLGECPMVWTDSDAEITAERDWKYTVKMLKSLPTVTPQPKTGRWIYTGDYLTEGMLKCSKCGKEIDVSESYYKFCPNCGAKMAESEEIKDE